MKSYCLLFLAAMLLTACATKPTNIKTQAPYVLLISVDGFRWDYIDIYQPKFLSQWVKDSARLTSLQPSFPTKTFPNHLSIVTGAYPQRHGIVANKFYAPDLKLHYSLKKPSAVLTPDFYLAKPLWVLAEEQGLRSASYFWPGSEALIAGVKPTFTTPYDKTKTHQDRINSVIQWYNLAENTRPHFTTMYFHEVDSAGHDYGQNSMQLVAAIEKFDRSFEQLINQLNLLPFQVNVVLVSDHGMAQPQPNHFEQLPQWLADNYIYYGKGPLVHLYDLKHSGLSLDQAVTKLNDTAQHYRCYQYHDIPSQLKASQSSRIGDIICLADNDWNIGFSNQQPIGNHGWNQFNTKDMDGIFYAKGPAFKVNYQHQTTQNIHIMPLLANILGLKISDEIDGKLAQLAPLLK